MFRFLFCFFITALLLAGCASKAKDIAPSYVSPLQFQHLNCHQIAQEMARISTHAAKLAGVADSNASSDAMTTAVAVVIFWPAAFMVKGDGQQAAEYAKLKGELEALEKLAIQKKCNIAVKRKAGS